MNVIPTIKKKISIPIAMKWSISENRLKGWKDEYGQGVFSDYFDISDDVDAIYCIAIFPDAVGHKGETWIYLCFESPNESEEIEGEFSVSMKEKETFFGDSLKGIYCCKTEELFDHEKGYIVDGMLTLTMNGTLLVEKETAVAEEKEGNCFGDHQDALCLGLWNDEEGKNVKIVADGKEITAHKNVLTILSPVFAKMFKSGLKEAQEGKVKIEDFSFEIVEAAIKLCYHPSLVSDASLDDKMKLLQFFDKYDIRPLKVQLEEHLISVINESNVCRLANSALLSNARQLETKCAAFLHNCLKKTTPISDFDLLYKDFAMDLLKNAFYPLSK